MSSNSESTAFDRLRELFRYLVAFYTVAAPVIALGLAPWLPLPMIGGLFFFHALLFCPTFLPNGSWFCPLTRRFDTDERKVVLTLDDGPDPVATPRVLDLLDRSQAKACFLVIGRKVRRHPELAREIVARGHERDFTAHCNK